MFDENEPIDGRILERAAELWVRMLRKPKFDNGDNSSQGGMAVALASMLPHDADEEKLQKFKTILIQKLGEKDKYGSFAWMHGLHVDYGPDKILADSAKDAELKVQFPWKTNMYIYRDHVGVSAGYGAKHVNHYPMSDGRWLMTDLNGTEISKVIEYLNGGQPMFDVEIPETAEIVE